MRTCLISAGLAAALLAPTSSSAQRYEAGLGGGWTYFSEYEALPILVGVYARARIRPSVAAHLALGYASVEENDDLRFVSSGKWYRRSQTTLDLGVRLDGLQEGRQDFGVNVGLSVRHRNDLSGAGLFEPDELDAQPGLLDALVAACEETPDCESRQVPGRVAHPNQTGTYLGLARTQQGFSPGGFLELEYGLRFGPVRTSLVANARRYLTSSGKTKDDGYPPEQPRWSGGVRLGYRF